MNSDPSDNGLTPFGSGTEQTCLQSIFERLACGFSLLLNAKACADSLGSDKWDFALEINELRRAGLTNNELRWLVMNRYVNQARETTLPGDDYRTFCPTGPLTLLPSTCFVLTKTGIEAAASFSFATLQSSGSSEEPNRSGVAVNGASDLPANGRCIATTPRWDPVRKELRFEGKLVKVFKWPASNQETVLAVFEEEGWPDRIDDPLFPVPEQDCKRRLHDTIKCLNRRHKTSLIRFRGDGSGEGVLWEVVEMSEEKTQLDKVVRDD